MEILIIGASLAGLSAARSLKEAKFDDFVVVDAKAEVGFPLKCGEAVDSDTLEVLYGPAVFQEPFVCHRTVKHTVLYRDVRREFEADYTQLDRPTFEKWLAAPISSHLKMGTRITHLERTADGFVATTSLNTKISCRCVIVCAGASHPFAAALPLQKKSGPLFFASGGLYSVESAPSLGDGFVWRVEDSLIGYVWSFRKGPEEWNVGAAGTEPKRLKERLDDFLKDSGAQRTKALGGHCPAGGPLKKTFGENFMVAGDAAGMVFAGTGEGIRYALLSGKFAAQTAIEAHSRKCYSAQNLSVYQKRWKRAFGRQLFAGVLFLKLLKLLIQTNQLETVIRRIPNQLVVNLVETGRIPWRYFPRLLLLKFRVLKRAHI